ncbi:rhodanese-like domain-containing protein [Pseudomonas borbori]|uniref:PQQ-dependent catabolism-associated CXXCW motif protein n=1 Tax=Pseudomonas borbori TaxID=289003 RepID=A0A1I5KAQ7_9PSED|nr:rhodanese-like domain-containing protein [Pseudomonas borbori]SFO82068.1 PQQ-dependent catabolism-associated CXXCW motif protein [Pseudomonas borbori]
MKHCLALSTGLSLIPSLLLAAPLPTGPSLFSAEGYRFSPTPSQAEHARAFDSLSVQRLLNEPLQTPPADAHPRQWRHGQFIKQGAHINPPGNPELANAGDDQLSSPRQNHFNRQQQQAGHGDKGRPLVFYCGADCRFVWNASKRAHSPGYRDLHWYRDGIDGWQQAGLSLIPAQPLVMP